MSMETRAMRDVFIAAVCERMQTDHRIMFLSADLGSPQLDELRASFPDRFINVGIAEQNLVNTAAGIAFEGFTVYAYAIAPFLTMRAFEQIRNNISLLSESVLLDVNLVGVGAGLSYDVSGPTHHCIEDLTIMRLLPNIALFSPSDWVVARSVAEHSFLCPGPKYIRLDGKPTANLYCPSTFCEFDKGFVELSRDKGVCVVSTGHPVHAAKRAIESLHAQGVHAGLVDVFRLKPFAEDDFCAVLDRYDNILTVEEGFAEQGGLDSLVLHALNRTRRSVGFASLGFREGYTFRVGKRERLHESAQLDETAIVRTAMRLARGDNDIKN